MAKEKSNLERIRELGDKLNFALLFEQAPDLYLVLDSSLTLVGASDSYLDATMTERDDIIGKHLFDVFPDPPGDAAQENVTGVSNLRASLAHVIERREPHEMDIQYYPIRRPSGEWEDRWWKPRNTPVFDRDGNLIYIIHRVEDVTLDVGRRS